MDKVFISIGTNQGDRFAQLTEGLEKIESTGRIISKSTIYETEAWGFDAEEFLNMVIEIETDLMPHDLLARLKEIERQMGREEERTGSHYSSRLIDFDILSYGDIEMNENGLQLPHPRMKERRFVLLPWNDIARYHYVSKYEASVSELLERCKDMTHCRPYDHV